MRRLYSQVGAQECAVQGLAAACSLQDMSTNSAFNENAPDDKGRSNKSVSVQ